MYDSIVIGSGIAGAIAARELAEKKQKKVLVIERRSHIGGNCYDKEDEHGILIHEYGPHIFHTNNKEIFDYLSRFTQWYEFRHKVVARVGESLIPVPFNLNTLHMIYEKEKADYLEEKLIRLFGMNARVPILELRQQEDRDISGIADYVYENIFLHYTMKQWGQTPEEIDPQVTNRVPIVISHEDGYFNDCYQGVPKEGYTKMFQNLLKHDNIEVMLNTEAEDVISLEDDHILFQGQRFEGPVIYTGALDELLNCQYGRLPYRTLRFQFEHHCQEDFQGHSVVNYTVSEDFTRITEFKHLTGQRLDTGTTIVKEYPESYQAKEGQIPYYAIMNQANKELYDRYKKEVQPISNLYLLGRLAEYQYYNIDAMAIKARDLIEVI